MRSRMSFWQYSRTFPPILVRLLAKSGAKPMTTQQIAEVSLLSPPVVEALSQAVNWNGVDVPTMFAFLRACRLDYCRKTDVHRARDYLRNPRWVYLRKSKQWRSYYQPMMRRYLESLEERG